ncbi:MAG: response regulator [Desulfobacula sp.]|nr:response regulator [Desulfobacula sp.]
MSIITITNGIYSNAEETVNLVSKKTNSPIITDEQILEKVHENFNVKMTTLHKVLDNQNIAFNDFTHEREKCLAYMKKIIADYACQGDIIFHGIIGHLIPKQITHVLKVLIITDKPARIEHGINNLGLLENQVVSNIDKFDKRAILWTNCLFNKKAWAPSLYDMVLPTDKFNPGESAQLILENVEKLLFNEEELIQKELKSLGITSDIEVVLSSIGQGLSVETKGEHAVVTIDKKVMMLGSFQQKIIQAVEKLPGISTVETILGKKYYSDTIIRNYEFETPLRILLVDDEKEFVHTLSERLKMRQFTSEIVYNGQEALDFTKEEDTQVMVLDLKMPDIDGFEVLEKIKQTNPEIEVIILTGHGTKQDKKTCMDLGAFAYLQKPADIDLLTETMKKAYAKIAAREGGSAS